MKASLYLKSYVPLIKFIGGPHVAPKNISHAVKSHPCAPDGVVPSAGSSSQASSYFNSNPIEPKEGEFFSRAQVSKRFRYSQPSESEIANVISGGAEVVF